MSRETRYKLRLIKKYAKIRFKRFWSEWGMTRYEFMDLLASMSIIVLMLVFSIVGTVF